MSPPEGETGAFVGIRRAPELFKGPKVTLEEKLAAAVETEDRGDGTAVLTEKSRQELSRISASALQEVAALKNHRTFTMSTGELVEISPIHEPHTLGGDPLVFHLSVTDEHGWKIHDQDHVVFNPPPNVKVGERDNPDFNALDPRSSEKLPVMVVDAEEAFRRVVVDHVQDAIDVWRRDNRK